MGDGKLGSCAHWLNFKSGLNLGAARERVRALTRVASRATEKGLSITPATAATRWRGEEMDYDLAVFLLWDKAQREMTAAAAGYPSLHVSAETPAVDRV